MTANEIPLERLHRQRLVGEKFSDPVDVVRWLGAAQSQDFAGAMWGIAQRCDGVTAAAMEKRFDDGAIVRTHALRPTWHFLAPEDLLWIQRLTAPRVHAANAYHRRQQQVDDAAVKQSQKILRKTLGRDGFCTREEIATAWTEGGLSVEGLRLVYLLMHAELDVLICSGPRRGKQFTYALVEQRAPTQRDLRGDEALAELARRYFQSHGPATANDFSWWSGLTVATAKRAILANGARLVSEKIGDAVHWFEATTVSTAAARKPIVQLVSTYDEHLVAYRDHQHSLSPEAKRALADKDPMRLSMILLNGVIVGHWGRTLNAANVAVECTVLRSLKPAESQALRSAVKRFGDYIGKRPVLTVSTGRSSTAKSAGKRTPSN